MNTVLKVGICLGLLGLGLPIARADIIFGVGTIPTQFVVDIPELQVGTSVSGFTTPGHRRVQFTQPTSAESLTASPAGQIQSTDGNGFTSLQAQFLGGDVFGGIKLDTTFAAAGTNFQVKAADGSFAQFTSTAGENSIYAYGTDGTLLESLAIIAPTNAINMVSEVEFAGPIQPAGVPEPPGWLLLAGVLGVGLVIQGWRRRRNSLIAIREEEFPAAGICLLTPPTGKPA